MTVSMSLTCGRALVHMTIEGANIDYVDSLDGAQPADTAACCVPRCPRPAVREHADRCSAAQGSSDPVRLRLMSLVASHAGGELASAISTTP